MKKNPIFIKGNLEFNVNGETIEHKNKNVSLFGISGLPWTPLQPSKHFGMKVIVNLKLLTPELTTMVTDAIIMREQSPYGEYMMLRFMLDERNKIKLTEKIQAAGFEPTQNIRKYPRIPRVDSIQSFPMRIIGVPMSKSFDVDPSPVVFDVVDLSLGGVLISSENPFAAALQPGHKMHLQFEPRGSFTLPIKVQGQICRAMEERNPQSGNMVRYFGLRFVKVDDDNKLAFAELLKDILTKMRPS